MAAILGDGPDADMPDPSMPVSGILAGCPPHVCMLRYDYGPLAYFHAPATARHAAGSPAQGRLPVCEVRVGQRR